MVLTPNASSWSHRVFGSSWRGLEPPRHLHIFAMNSMRAVFRPAGFYHYTILPFILTSVIYDRILLRHAFGRAKGGAPQDHSSWILNRFLKVV